MTTELERLAAEAVVLAGGDHPCTILGHKWVFYGGKNAGCDRRDCDCSVPVNECEACGDCDYGENAEADEIRAEERETRQIARPLSEWHEGIGSVLWWKFPIEEPPYIGSPLDAGHTVEITVHSHGVDKLMRVNVGGWPGYHTHWTPIIIPAIRETDSDA